ncbi:hypothetical protein Chor_006185 [Crotalus horridus]
MTLIDLIIYGTLRALNIRGVRWSRPLRPIFLINFAESRQIRRAFRSIRNTLPEITYVFLLFMFSVLMFSLMALKLFGDRNLKTLEGLPYFTNYLEVVFDMYVLVTTANSPDIMMPAYDYSWWYSLFFIIYVIINTYIFMSVFLAVVYNNYRKHLKNEIRKLAYMKHHKMIEAFNLLKVKERDEFVIQEDQWKSLVKLVAPQISASHRELLLRVSDEEQKGYVDKKSFVRLADLLNIEVITLKAHIHPLDIWFPQDYFCKKPILELAYKNYRQHPQVPCYYEYTNKHCAYNANLWSISSAFILEAFFVEYSIEKSEVETAIEKKIQELGIGVQEDDLFDGRLIDNLETIENDLGSEEGMAVKKKPKGLMFKIASRRYRTVDALLQRMFESEIAPEEEGPSLDEILNLSPDETYPGNPAFDRAA